MTHFKLKCNNRYCTHRVDVEGRWATQHGKHSGLTASQRSFQCVVRGIDCCFASWVLECEVGMSKPIRLRKHQKMTTLDTDQKTVSSINSFSKLYRKRLKSQSGCVRLRVPRNKQIPQGGLAPVPASPNYSQCQFPFCDVG